MPSGAQVANDGQWAIDDGVKEKQAYLRKGFYGINMWSLVASHNHELLGIDNPPDDVQILSHLQGATNLIEAAAQHGVDVKAGLRSWRAQRQKTQSVHGSRLYWADSNRIAGARSVRAAGRHCCCSGLPHGGHPHRARRTWRAQSGHYRVT